MVAATSHGLWTKTSSRIARTSSQFALPLGPLALILIPWVLAPTRLPTLLGSLPNFLRSIPRSDWRKSKFAGKSLQASLYI